MADWSILLRRFRRSGKATGEAVAPRSGGSIWLWKKPQVTVALSGMSTMQQVQENVVFAGRLALHILSEADLALVARVLRPVRRNSAPSPAP